MDRRRFLPAGGLLGLTAACGADRSVGYRADRVTSVPADGYDLLWDPAYKGKAYVLDDAREGLAMAMLRDGVADVNTEDPATIRRAGDRLAELIGATNIKIGISAYQLVPEGQATVHHCWSGDMVNAQSYLPKGVKPTCSATGSPPAPPGSSAPTRSRSRAPRPSPCWRTCSSTTCSTPPWRA
ncbi:hypothetical protein AB0B89_21195 [Sphaerisporangium sp. NPDC049002]|uniref:hypothetical protein n=1 Tax=unclassified Sphaerisporangium TaxID=2630420 RepID=UPI0034069649